MLQARLQMKREHLHFQTKSGRNISYLDRTHQAEFIFLLLVYSHQHAIFFIIIQIGFHESQACLKLSVAKDELELDPLWCITGIHHQTWFTQSLRLNCRLCVSEVNTTLTKSQPKPCTRVLRNSLWA